MPAGWNQTSGTFREGPIDEDTFWMLFNYVFSDSSAKRTTYKFGLIKSILDNLFNSEGEAYSLFISYENLFVFGSGEKSHVATVGKSQFLTNEKNQDPVINYV